MLLFSDLHLWASIFSVILVNYIFMDGKSDYFQGKFSVSQNWFSFLNVKFKHFSKMLSLFSSLTYECNCKNIAEIKKKYYQKVFFGHDHLTLSLNECGKWIITTAKQASGRVSHSAHLNVIITNH